MNNSDMCHISKDGETFVFGVLFGKIPCCDPEVSPFKLMGGQLLLSILKIFFNTLMRTIFTEITSKHRGNRSK